MRHIGSYSIRETLDVLYIYWVFVFAICMLYLLRHVEVKETMKTPHTKKQSPAAIWMVARSWTVSAWSSNDNKMIIKGTSTTITLVHLWVFSHTFSHCLSPSTRKSMPMVLSSHWKFATLFLVGKPALSIIHRLTCRKKSPPGAQLLGSENFCNGFHYCSG